MCVAVTGFRVLLYARMSECASPSRARMCARCKRTYLSCVTRRTSEHTLTITARQSGDICMCTCPAPLLPHLHCAFAKPHTKLHWRRARWWLRNTPPVHRLAKPNPVATSFDVAVQGTPGMVCCCACVLVCRLLTTRASWVARKPLNSTTELPPHPAPALAARFVDGWFTCCVKVFQCWREH